MIGNDANELRKEKIKMIKQSPSKAPAANMPKVTYKPKPKPKPQPKAIAPAIGVKIYDSVKSGKIKLDDLNDDGVRALREHMERTQPGKYGDSSGNVNELRNEKIQTVKQNPKSAPAVSAKKIAKNVKYDDRNKVQKVLDRVFRENPVAATISYPFATVSKNLGLYGDDKIPSTGSKIVDKTLGKVGDLSTPIASELISGGGIGVANLALGVGEKLALEMGSKVAPKIAQTAIRGSAAGLLTGAGASIGRGDSLADTAKNASYGALFGGAGDVALGAIVKGVRSVRNASDKSLGSAKVKPLDEIVNRTTAEPVKAPARMKLQNPVPLMKSSAPVQENITPPKVTGPPKVTLSKVAPKRAAKPKEPVKLDELVQSKGHADVTPETIAQTYNGKTWYHGTGTDKLTADTLDPFIGSHESLFGQGVYLTDNPKIAEGYAKSRGRRTGTSQIYQTDVNVNRVLDLENPPTPDVVAAIDKTMKPLDYSYSQHFDDPDYFTRLVADEAQKGSTVEQMITRIRNEVKSFSHEAGIPTSEFVQDFQDLAVNLKRAGYDGLTHTGGHRTGNEAHRVLIMLDPQNVLGESIGARQVARFDKYAQKTPQRGDIGRTRTLDEIVNGAAAPSKLDEIVNGIPEQAVQETATAAEPMRQNWFTSLFGNRGIGISASSSTKRVGNKPLTTEDVIVKKGIKSDTEGLKAEIAAQGRAVYQNHVDALSPFKRVNSQTYDAAIDASRANNLANNIIGKDFVTPEGVRIGDGMETIFGKVARGQDKQFIDYLILRDAGTRVARGERVYDESLGMTPEKISQRIEMYDKRHPGFAAIAKDWDTFTNNLRETYGVKEGLITKAQNKAMVESRPNYIKMMRQFSRSEKPGRKWLGKSAASTFSGQKAPINKVSPTGSVRNIIDPRKTMMESVGAWVNAAMRNRPMQEVVKAIQENPEGMRPIAEIVPETAEATKKSLDEINDILANDGLEGLLEQLNGEFDLAFKKGGQKGADDNVVRVMVNGMPVKIRIHDPELVKAVTGMSPQQAGIIIDVLSKFSNAIKRGATGALAPLFAARSATIDLVQALIQSKNPVRHGPDLVHAIFSSIGDKLNIPGLRNLAVEFRRAGGEYSGALRGERELNKRLGNLRRDPILSPQNLARQTGRLLASPFKVGEAISDVAENVHRIAAYKGELRRLGGQRTPENVRKAINEGREITTNFSRKGAHSRELEALVPYQNAAIQGTYRIMKAFKHNPIKTTAGVATLAVLPKLYEYAQFHDDPDYQKLPARERFRNLIVHKNDDGTFVKVPMEPAYNSFGELTIETLRHFKDNDPQAFKGTMDALANAWIPPIITGALQGVTQGTGPEGGLEGFANSTSIAPFSAVISNRSFTGAPLVSRRLEGNSPGQQYDERTSEPAKWIGNKIGMSPLKIDYLLKSYGGDPARLLLPLLSDVGAGTARNTLLKNFIADPVFTNTLSNDFYRLQEKITQAKSDNRTNGKKFPSWYDKKIADYATNMRNDGITKKLSALGERKRSIQANKKLSAQVKAQQLRSVQAKMNEIYLDAVIKMQNGGVPMR